MPNKLQLITELLIFSTKQSTSSVADWKAFLSSSAWHYKYGYTDRLLIHAQRPNATSSRYGTNALTEGYRRVRRALPF